jgi:hypothetical protein
VSRVREIESEIAMSYLTLASCLSALIGFNVGWVVHGIAMRHPRLPK